MQKEIKAKYVKCKFCNGMGEISSNPDIPCPDCHGTGKYKIGYTFIVSGIAIDADTLK